jgi:sarcosine oxidase
VAVQSFEVIVAGLGAMGSAALDHLAGRGISALGLDPYPVPHDHGSSGGDTRLIRQAYFEHPDYVPLLRRAYQNWRDLEADTGERLLHQTGTVYLGPPDGELIAGSRLAAERHGVALDVLGGDELVERFPGFRCPDGYQALFEPDAGFLLCERAIHAQVKRARRRGAQIVSGERLLNWRSEGGAIEVTTNRDRYTAGALVLTLGAWSGELLGDLGLRLRVTRQPLFWLQPDDPEAFALGNRPCWAVERPDAPGLFYGLPALPGGLGTRPGVKVAHHAPGEETRADDPRRPAEPRELQAVLAALAACVPGLQGPATHSHVCLYTNSADGHFVVDLHPRHDNVVFGCGFSGHGFKFASVVGEVLADLALGGATGQPAQFLRRR